MDKIIIEKNNSGKRIDKFLAKEFFSYTRGEIIRQIKNGNISVNGNKVKPSYILKENDNVFMKHIKHNIRQHDISPNAKIKLEVIFKDENIIVVNKPAGIQVHPDNNEKKDTLANALIAEFPEIKSVGEDPVRPGIVHRLDKDTSGIIVIARNQEAFEELKELFKNRKVEKKYLAIVYGSLENREGIIEKPIARSSDYRKQVIAGKKTRTKIREAVTEFRVVREIRNFSLVEISPKTGRMHQIRVHMASIGHPVAGDKVYKPKNNKNRLTVFRQLLHAKSIKFRLFSKDYCFELELPDDFREFLSRG